MDIFQQAVPTRLSHLDLEVILKHYSVRRTELVQGRYMSCADAQTRHSTLRLDRRMDGYPGAVEAAKI